MKVLAIFLLRIRTQIKCLTVIKANRCRESIMISNTTKDTICSLLVKIKTNKKMTVKAKEKMRKMLLMMIILLIKAS